MKLSIAIVPCPRCGTPLVHKDMSDIDLAEARCEICRREYEVRMDPETGETEIKEKRTN
jgi:uncharacterized Zn finger protein (UPF0148 family)